MEQTAAKTTSIPLHVKYNDSNLVSSKLKFTPVGFELKLLKSVCNELRPSLPLRSLDSVQTRCESSCGPRSPTSPRSANPPTRWAARLRSNAAVSSGCSIFYPAAPPAVARARFCPPSLPSSFRVSGEARKRRVIALPSEPAFYSSRFIQCVT